MSNNDFMLDIIVKLNKLLSEKSIQNDLRTMDNKFYVKVLAKLTKTLATKELQNQLKQLNNLDVQVGANVKIGKDAKNKLEQNIKMLQSQISNLEIGLSASKTQQAKLNSDIVGIRKRLQSKINSEPLEFKLEIKKQKLISDIEYLGKRYSKLFSNTSASKKYENLMQNALLITGKGQLADTRTELAAFTSELKANGLASKSTADRWAGLFGRAKDLFSAASVVRILFTQMRQAISTTLSLDKTYTDLIKVQDDITRNDYPEYLEKCNKKAQELATTQQSLIESATEFSKSGYNSSESNSLSERSIKLANVGDMSASDSAKAIISGVQAYNTIDGYDDVINKADALIDKYNEIGNTASITTAEIAKGVQSVGSVFADANTSVDEFIALLSAGNRQFQDADSLSLGLRTSALRIRGCTAELEAMGEETDGVVTSTSKLAEKIEALTSINGNGGVKILEDDEQTFRSIYDIYSDIGKVYKQMSDTDQSALLELIAGKHRASGISAVLNNMTEAQEILQNSLNSAGSAEKEYEKYLESAEAHINQFKAKLVETYSTFMSGDTIKYATDFGSAMLDILNYTDLLRHGLLAIASIKIGEGVSAIGLSIADAAKQMNTLGGAIQKIMNLPLDSVLKTKVLADVGNATKNLTDKNLKLLLSQEQLLDNDKVQILLRHNLTEEEAEAKLIKMGLITTTNAQTTANAKETVSTFTLSGAMTTLKASAIGAWQAMKAAFLSNPIGITLMGVTTIISALSTVMSNHKQKLEELSASGNEAASAFENASSSVEDYTNKYKELHTALINAKGNEEETYNIKKQLLDLQTELNDKFGEEYGKLNLVTDAYKDQTEAIKAYNAEAAKTFLNENEKEIRTATRLMTDEKHYNLSYTGNSAFTDEGKALKEVAEQFKDSGITLLDELDTGDYSQFSIHLTADAQSAYETINAFESALREKAEELGNEDIFDDVLEISSSELKRAKSIIDDWGQIYKQSLLSEIASSNSLSSEYNKAVNAVQNYNDAVLQSEDPYNDANVKSAYDSLQTIKAGIQGNADEWDKYSSVTDKVFDEALTSSYEFYNSMKANSQDLLDDITGLTDTELLSMSNDGQEDSFDKLCASAEKYGLSIQDVIDLLVHLGVVQSNFQNSSSDITPTLSISDTLSKLNTELKPAFDSLKSAYNDIFTTEDGKKIFTPENIDFSTLDSIKSKLDDMAELGLDVDYSSFENFASVLNNVSSTEKQVDEAFDSLASSIAKAGINGTEDFTTLKAALDDLGVVNGEIIAFEALTMNTKALADAGLDLVKATDEELVAFANETVSAEYAEQALGLLQYRKELLSGTALDTTASVQNLINLAEQAKISAEKIGLLQNLLQMISQADLAMQVGNYHIVDSLTPQIEALKKRIQSDTVIDNEIEYAPKSKSAASKSGKKTADAWLEAYKKELAELEHIHDMEEITDREFYENLRDLNEKYFNDTSEHHEKYLDEYRSNEEKVAKGLKDVWTKYWEDYKSDLDKVSSYAERVLSRQIDSLKDKQDNEIDGYDGEMDAIDDKIKALEEERKTVERNYQGQIDAIQKQIDAYDDEIDKLKEISEEKSRQLQLEQDIYELERLRSQKTQKEYVEGRGIVYKVDSGAIRDQEHKVENDRIEIEIAGYEKLIKGLEAQQDSLKAKMDDIVSSIDAQIDKLNDQKDGIQDKIDAVNKSYESQIEALEKYKDKWSEVSEHQSMLEEEAIARQLFGVNAEAAILEMREGILNDYIGRYQMASDNLAMITDAKLHDISGILAQMQTSADTVSLLSGGLQDSFVTFQTTFSEFNSAADTVDTTKVKENLSTAGTVADSTSGQLENITTKLNELAAEVSSFTLPPLNTEQFTASLGTADSATGILGQLRTYTERFRELCMSIPTIWNEVLSAISGSGLVSGEDRDYNALFTPLLAAMDNCKFQMDTKLAEYVTAWTDFNMDLGAVIGTGGDSGTSSGGDKKSVKDARKPKGGNKESGDISTDSIVGTIQSGGDMINAVFDDTWVPGFKTMGEQINEICQKVVECVNEMAENTVDACRKAVDAINKANAAKKSSSSSNEKPEKFRGNTYTGRAFARGTLPLKQDVDDALVGELGAEIVANTETGAYRIVGRNGAEFTDLNKGDVVISHTQTEQILRDNSLDYLLPQFADVVLSPEFMTQHIKPQFKNPMEDYYDEIQAQMNMQLGAAHESTPTPVVQEINISLPNVKNGNDAQELIKTLERLPLDTIQYIHKH